MKRFVTSLVAVVVLLGPACSDDSSSPATTETTAARSDTLATAPPEGISQDEAVAIARDAYAEEEPDFSFDDRFDYVSETADTYDVSWPLRDPEGPGGEPHVVVDRVSGEVVDIYLTR